MSNSTCLNGPPFSITGITAVSGQQFDFAFGFDNAEDAQSALGYEWYLNEQLILNSNDQQFNGSLGCGNYTIGGRLLTAGGWSGLKELNFTTCAAPVSTILEGPAEVDEGTSATYKVMGTYADGTITDISGQYVFHTTVGTFTGNVLTIPANTTTGDTRTAHLSTFINTDEPGPVKDITVNDTTVIEINDFDFMVIRYHWLEGAGHDLDILVGFENTTTVYDNLYVGYGNPQKHVPADADPASDSYLWWGEDNSSDFGYEGVLVGMKKFVTENTATPDIITVGLYAVWFGEPITGQFTVELATYLGGSMSIENNNFVHTGGSNGQSASKIITTMVHNQDHSVTTAYKVATLSYNRITQHATIF